MKRGEEHNDTSQEKIQKFDQHTLSKEMQIKAVRLTKIGKIDNLFQRV